MFSFAGSCCAARKALSNKGFAVITKGSALSTRRPRTSTRSSGVRESGTQKASGFVIKMQASVTLETRSLRGEIERKEGSIVAEWASGGARYTVVKTRLRATMTCDGEPLDTDDLDLEDRRKAKKAKR